MDLNKKRPNENVYEDRHILKKRMIQKEPEEDTPTEIDELEEDTPTEIDELEEDTPTEIDELEEDTPTEIDESTDIDDSDVESAYESEFEDDLSLKQEYEPTQYRNPLFNPSILCVTCHGNIVLDDDKNYVHTTIPDGIELIKISISAPGVVHCSDNKNTNRNLIEIIKSIPSLLDENLNENTLINLVKHISTYVEKYSVSPIIEQKRSGHLFNIYKEHYSKGFKIHKLLPGDKIANKKYWRYYGDKNKNKFILAKMDNEHDVHKISESKYKIPKLHDLFEEFYTEQTYDENDYQDVNLQQILEYYKNRGTSRLILFDFSCSVFENAEFYYTSGPGLQQVVEQNKHIPSGGKFNKKSHKRKSYKRKTCKRKSCKRKTCKRKTCKRKSCKRKFHKK
jgi:hypothetical protein